MSKEGSGDLRGEWLILTQRDCSQQSRATTEGPGAQPNVPSPMAQCLSSHLLIVQHLLSAYHMNSPGWLGVVDEISQYFLGNESQGTCPIPIIIGLAKTFIFFPYDGSSSTQLSLTSFEIILLDCIVTAVISACIRKKYQNW